jgi:GDPmannose 4,6-dehydratase
MKNAIVFGITGQDGSHLADLLLKNNYTVTGVARRASTDNTQRIKHILSNPKFQLIEGDITDASSVLNVLKFANSSDNHTRGYVDEIYNLAAQSHVGTSFKQPGLTWDITGKGCINILQTMVDLNMFETRFYQASSSEMYGDSFDIDQYGVRYQDENTKFLPQSPYAIAKCAAHYSVRLFREAYDLHASAGILFNHEGPRRGDNFVTKKITNWVVGFIKWMESNSLKTEYLCFSDTMIHGLKDTTFPKLRLGNLDSYRDWGYAGDYVEAMWLMLQQETPDDYVICTGNTYKVRDFLDYAFNHVNLSHWDRYVYIDPELYRPAEVNFLRGDCSKAKRVLGWSPKNNLQNLVSLMIESRFHEKLQING